MALSSVIFRAYDIRGIIGTEWEPHDARLIGRAYSTYLSRRSGITSPSIVVGRDGRLSSPAVQEAFLSGCQDVGAQVTDAGLTPSPVLYHAICAGGFDGGVNVTASHNPSEYNGLKLCEADAHAIAGEEIAEIARIVREEDWVLVPETQQFQRETLDHWPSYLERAQSTERPLDGMKVVVDAGSGIAGPFAPELLRSLGAEVVELYCELDGSFPHHQPDPEDPANLIGLKQAVREQRADYGVAYDGDADRVGIVDSEGRHFSADHLLLLLGRDLLTRHPGANIVLDLKSSSVVFRDLESRGALTHMAPTGHSFVEELMHQKGALLGGEVSGHIFCAENAYGYDDALLASLRLLAIFQGSGQGPHELLADLPQTFITDDLKYPTTESTKFPLMKEVIRLCLEHYSPEQCLLLDGVRVDLPDGSWGILRASNTSPKLTGRYEAPTAESLETLQSQMESLLELARSRVTEL